MTLNAWMRRIVDEIAFDDESVILTNGFILLDSGLVRELNIQLISQTPDTSQPAISIDIHLISKVKPATISRSWSRDLISSSKGNNQYARSDQNS